MRSKEIKKAIDSLGPWKQRYEMEGQFTTDSKIAGEPVWKDIRSLFCENLKDQHILELECSAGYYSVKMSMENAIVTVVTGGNKYFSQARWTQYFFEQKDGKKYPIKFINKEPTSIDFNKLDCWYDYIFSDNGLDYFNGDVEKQKDYISYLCHLTDKILLRIPNSSITSSIGYYNSIFLENEFYMLKRLNREIPILLYGRLVKEPFLKE